MQLGYIGLGKMGKNMVLRLLEQGHQITAWNRSPEPTVEVQQAGAEIAENIEALVESLPSPKIIWVMLPAGKVTGEMIAKLSTLLAPGDLVIDGANSHFKDTKQRAALLAEKKMLFADVGVSGGPEGARQGACLMIGGTAETYALIEPLCQAIAAPGAYHFFAGHGAGHFVKMVHNGIEYGMMQAIGEGFEVMRQSEFNLDLAHVASLYNRGSVIESRLIGWLESGYAKHGPELAGISGTVKHSGEGQWTVETAAELEVPVPVIKTSFDFRVESEQKPSYTGQVVSVLRQEFGGHNVKS